MLSFFKKKVKEVIVPNDINLSPVSNEPNTDDDIKKRYRESISERLKRENLKFVECDTRMNYGMIGWIYRNNERAIHLFGTTFYVHDKNIPINLPNIELIRAIQKEFKDVTRDKNNNICVDPKGFGAIDK